MIGIRIALLAIATVLFCSAGKIVAQTPTRMGPASDEEIRKAFVAVKADLNSFKAHRAYIFAMGMKNPQLWEQYEAWMKAYPRNLDIPLSIGTVYYRAAMQSNPPDCLVSRLWSLSGGIPTFSISC